MKKLRTIYLVDDDEGINFLNKAILSRLQLAEEVVAFRDPTQAIESLKTAISQGNPPELIFLDINMPLMDGWEFVESYSKIEMTSAAKPVIVMLSSSIDPADEKKANSISQISAFKSKPLTFDTAHEIVNGYFKD